MWWAAAYHRRLLGPGIPAARIKMITRNYLLGTPSYLLATFLAFWNPFVGMGICTVLWIFWAYTNYEVKPGSEPKEA